MEGTKYLICIIYIYLIYSSEHILKISIITPIFSVTLRNLHKGHQLGSSRTGFQTQVCLSRKMSDRQRMPCVLSSCWSWQCPSASFSERKQTFKEVC